MSGNKTTVFKSEESKRRDEAAVLIRELADRVGEGMVTLRQGAEELTLDVPEHVVLEIQVDEKEKAGKGMRHSLEIEIEWYEGGPAGGPLEVG